VLLVETDQACDRQVDRVKPGFAFVLRLNETGAFSYYRLRAPAAAASRASTLATRTVTRYNPTRVTPAHPNREPWLIVNAPARRTPG
jgi:hypothetical protein